MKFIKKYYSSREKTTVCLLISLKIGKTPLQFDIFTKINFLQRNTSGDKKDPAERNRLLNLTSRLPNKKVAGSYEHFFVLGFST